MTKVLVVDDDKNFLMSVGYFLATKGYEPIPAKDGMEALVKFEETHPHAILLDVLLPKLNGFEVCRRIRETGDRIPIILTSAVYKKYEVQTEAKTRFGATDYLVKPIKPEELVERLKKFIGKTDEDNPQEGVSRRGSSIEWPEFNPSLQGSDKRQAPCDRGVGSEGEDDDSGVELVLIEEKSQPLKNVVVPHTLEGEIKKDTIGALILHLHRIKASGILEIFSCREKRMIFFINGAPVFASSFSLSESYSAQSVLRIIRGCLDLETGTYYFKEGLDFLDYIPTYDLPISLN